MDVAWNEHSGLPVRPGRFRWAPLVPLVLATSLGIVIDRYAEPWETATWAALALGAGAAALLATNREVAGNLAVVVAFGALGGGWHHGRWTDRGLDNISRSVGEVPRPVWVRGVVQEVLGVRPDVSKHYGRPGEGRPDLKTRFVVDMTARNDGRAWRPASGRAIAIAAGDRGDFIEGDGVEIVGQVAAIAGPLNPGEFDYRRFLRGQGIDVRLTIDDTDGLRPDPEGSADAIGRLLGRIRAWSRQRLVGGIDARLEPLAAALLLGRREGVDPEVNDAFARTGTTHLLAISGLHMQVLAAALLIAARVVGIPRRPAFVVVAVATIAYGALVGPAPSVVRSTVMTVTFCLAAIAGRMTRPANILSLAALGTLAVNPMYLFDVGCQLSFLAIAALIWLVPPAAEALRRLAGAVRDRVLGPRSPLDELERSYEPRWRKWIRARVADLVLGVIASTVVWLAALPLVALRFHIVAPIGILLNIPLIPFTSSALLLGGLGLGLSAVWGPLGVPASRAAGVLLDVTQRVVLWGVRQPWGYRFVAGPSWGWVVVFYLWLALTAVAATSWLRRERARARAPKTAEEIPDGGRLRRLAPCALLGAWSLGGWVLAIVPFAPRTAEADALAVGHGLAVVLHTPGGRVLLYDCGRMGDSSVGRRIIAPALWSRGVSRIDEVILSHADQDHFNGLPDLLDRFAVGLVRVPPGFGGPANPAADRLLAEVQSRGIPIRPTAAPEDWDAGGVRLAARHPRAGWFPRAPDNARSLVLDVEHGGRHLLLTGDLEGIGLFDLIAHPRPEPAPDVMLAPHHGGRSANPASLYEWAGPRTVVVSQRSPRAGTADALTPLERREVPLWRTWRDGAIRLRWAEGGIAASGFLGRSEPPAAPSARQGRSNPGPTWPLAFITLGAWPSGWRLLIGLAGFVVGLILWGVVTVVEFGAWTLVVPPRADPRRARHGESYLAAPDHAVSPVPIEAQASDGARLAGRWYPVQGQRANPRTVLLLHGFAEDPSVWEAARASILNRHGWNVVALDSRGYGRSGGLYASFGGREAGDVSAWLDAIAERLGGLDGSTRSPVAIWGRSMGAAIALRAAANDRRIAALVLESPMVDLDESVAGLLRKRGLRFTGLLARLITRRAGRIARVSLVRPRPVDVARLVGCRALIVHGTDDWLVPPAAIRRLAEAFASPPARIEVPGAGHSNVVGTGGWGLIGRIAEFLDASPDAIIRLDGQEASSPPRGLL